MDSGPRLLTGHSSRQVVGVEAGGCGEQSAVRVRYLDTPRIDAWEQMGAMCLRADGNI